MAFSSRGAVALVLAGLVASVTAAQVRRALVISLAEDSAKWEATRRSLRETLLDLDIQRIPGIEVDSFKLHSLLLDGAITPEAYNDVIERDTEVTGVRLTQGSLGCLLAHVAAWKIVAAGGQPVAIFEDDASIKSGVTVAALRALDELPDDFDLLYFGNSVGFSTSGCLEAYSTSLKWMRCGNYGTFAYVISPHAAALLLDLVFPAYAQVDSFLIDLTQQRQLARVFTTASVLVTTANFAGRASHTQRWTVPEMRIPRVFHFVWVGSSPPPSVHVNMSRWLAIHPGWGARLWQESDVTASMLNQDAFAASNDRREKSDMLCYEVVCAHGGVYADLDLEPLRNIEPILRGLDAFVAFESATDLSNGIFGAVPKHDFLQNLVADLPVSIEARAGRPSSDHTGSKFVSAVAMRLRQSPNLVHLTGETFAAFSSHVFFPVSRGQIDRGRPFSPLSFAVPHFERAEHSDLGASTLVGRSFSSSLQVITSLRGLLFDLYCSVGPSKLFTLWSEWHHRSGVRQPLRRRPRSAFEAFGSLTISPTITITISLSQSRTPSASLTQSPSQTPSASPSKTASPSRSQASTLSETSTPSSSRTVSTTATISQIESPTPSPTASPSATLTVTLTRSGSQDSTRSSSLTASQQPTPSQLYSASQSTSRSPSKTASVSPTQSQGASNTQSASGTPTQTATPTLTPSASATMSTRPTPPPSCFNRIQDGYETDVDCGGKDCAPCPTGRRCLYSGDCDSSLTSTEETVYPAGTRMAVCETPSRICIDLRAGRQAYPPGGVLPQVVELNLTVVQLDVALLSALVVTAIRNAVADTINSSGACPALFASDVLLMHALSNDSPREAPVAADASIPEVELWLALLLRNSTIYDANSTVAAINDNATALVTAVQSAIIISGGPDATNVSVLFTDPASIGSLQAPIATTGPSNVTRAATPAPPPARNILSLIGLVIGGVAITAIAISVITGVAVTRSRGTCCRGKCCVSLATCCGAWPLQRRLQGKSQTSNDNGAADSSANASATIYLPLSTRVYGSTAQAGATGRDIVTSGFVPRNARKHLSESVNSPAVTSSSPPPPANLSARGNPFDFPITSSMAALSPPLPSSPLPADPPSANPHACGNPFAPPVPATAARQPRPPVEFTSPVAVTGLQREIRRGSFENFVEAAVTSLDDVSVLWTCKSCGAVTNLSTRPGTRRPRFCAKCGAASISADSEGPGPL